MKDELGAKNSDLRAMTDGELVQFAVQRKTLTQLEVELTLRLEAHIEIHGDYLIPGD